jgi:hypothetical protein
MTARIVLTIIAAFTLSSCFVPVPHMRLHLYGVRGRVVDADSHLPVANVTISSPPDKRVATSSADGYFSLKPVYGWHGAYLFSPISQSLFPPLDVSPRHRKMDVSAPGYQSKHMSFFGPSTKLHRSSRSFLDGQTIELHKN